MDSITVLLSTYNGEKYLEEQLESLFSQENVELLVLVRDDGSTDGTISILKEWEEKKLSGFKWNKGSHLGAGRSFLNLLQSSEETDYYAFCDQDDVWMPRKLINAIEKLRVYEKNVPVIYTSNVNLVDNQLKHIGYSEFHPTGTLGDALIFNQAVGCTMVFNKALKNKVCLYKPEYLFLHDCWTYRVCIALGGKAVFDKDSYILYRQHGDNAQGAKADAWERWMVRIKETKTCKKDKRKRMSEELLKGYGEYMDQKNKELVSMVAFYDRSLKNRLKLVKEKQIFTRSYSYNCAVRLAILTGKL